MTHVKTAISLRKDLFVEANKMARKMKISRSRLLEAAFEDFVRKVEDRQLVEGLNAFYAKGPDEEELQFMAAAKRLRKPLLKDNPW